MPTDLFNISGKPPTDLKRHGLANVTMESSIYRLVVQPILLPLQPLLFLCVCMCVCGGGIKYASTPAVLHSLSFPNAAFYPVRTPFFSMPMSSHDLKLNVS